jgi:hypothetical protein
MNDRELMQQALEALVASGLSAHATKKAREVAINALRERLAQPEQEPVAWSWEHDGRVVNAFPFKPDAESDYWKAKGWTTRPLVYGDTAPPPRQWVGLTNEAVNAQVEAEMRHYWNGKYIDSSGARDQLTDFARAIETKLKEKNT